MGLLQPATRGHQRWAGVIFEGFSLVGFILHTNCPIHISKKQRTLKKAGQTVVFPYLFTSGGVNTTPPPETLGEKNKNPREKSGCVATGTDESTKITTNTPASLRIMRSGSDSR